METGFFLASNSGKGFYSLYDAFPPEGSFLHIIKGGPGTGKSGFMKRIAAAAAARGMDTELIYCSADPDSLDGLYIPTINQAWMDGTAPHTRDAALFAVDSDYVNLGAFCRRPLKSADAARAMELNREYKQLYASAYKYLAAEAQVANAYEAEPLEREQLEPLGDMIADIIAGEQRGRKKGNGRQSYRFISAISGSGKLCLENTVKKLCKQNYSFSEPLHAHQLLSLVAQMARERGLRAILCPEPLRPDMLEAVLLPELELCFGRADPEQGRGGLEVSFGREPRRSNDRQQEQAIRESLRTQATARLKQAKKLHDDMEAVYRPYMDFAALDDYTEDCIDSIFK